MDKSTAQYMEGDKLTCPNCGKMEFSIGHDDIWTEGDLYADCVHCHTSTLVELLKEKYNDKDFEVYDTEDVTIEYECTKCGEKHELEGSFKLTHYFGTMYDKFEPEPDGWICPKHLKAQVNMLIG